VFGCCLFKGFANGTGVAILIYRQLYAFGIRISNIDSEIEKELKKSA